LGNPFQIRKSLPTLYAFGTKFRGIVPAWAEPGEKLRHNWGPLYQEIGKLMAPRGPQEGGPIKEGISEGGPPIP